MKPSLHSSINIFLLISDQSVAEKAVEGHVLKCGYPREGNVVAPRDVGVVSHEGGDAAVLLCGCLKEDVVDNSTVSFLSRVSFCTEPYKS